MSKVDDRLNAKKFLSSLSQKDILDKSKLIAQNLDVLFNSYLSSNKNLVVGGFVPFEKEPQWGEGLKFDYKFLLPKVYDDWSMKFVESDINDVATMDWRSRPQGKSLKPDVLLIPGLAFDDLFNRLGRGKGCYDRFLAKNDAVKIGIFFDEQRLNNLTVEEHDIKMDYIVTDVDIYINEV